MGTKRKIEIEKRETPQQRSVACNKRRRTVFKKASDLCLHAGANVAVFVTSPAENNDVVYSFSGYSPASEIADCFLNGKLPPPPPNPQEKLGFYWEDPDLYTYCDDVSELNIIEDRLARMKKDILECIALKEKGKQVGESFDQNLSSSSPHEIYVGSSSQIAIFDQNPSSSSSDEIRVESCSQIVLFDQNPSSSSPDEFYGGSSSQIAIFDQNPSSSSPDEIYVGSSSQIVIFDQNPSSSSSDKIRGESCSQIVLFDQNPSSSSPDEFYGGSSSQIAIFDQNPSSFDTEIQGESSSFFEDNGLWKTKEENNSITLTQETQPDPIMVNNDEESFWDILYSDDVFGLINSDLDNNTNTTNEEGDLMIDIAEFFTEEEIELLPF